jgi:hypothetical protein
MDTKFTAIEREMQRQHEQHESIKGKNPQYRVEFRFTGGTRHWEYYETYEECVKAPDSKSCKYSPFGSPYIQNPSSRQIQHRGPRGGWNPYKQQKA